MSELKDIIAAVTPCKGADFELQTLKIRQPQGDEVWVKVDVNAVNIELRVNGQTTQHSNTHQLKNQ